MASEMNIITGSPVPADKYHSYFIIDSWHNTFNGEKSIDRSTFEFVFSLIDKGLTSCGFAIYQLCIIIIKIGKKLIFFIFNSSFRSFLFQSLQKYYFKRFRAIRKKKKKKTATRNRFETTSGP